MNVRLFLLTLFTVSLLSAVDQSNLFERANDFYREHKYEHAMSDYQSIKQKDGAVWYNMGNTAYRQEDFLNAYIYWLRAQKYGDMHIFKGATYNLEHLAVVQGKEALSLIDRISLFFLSLTKRLSLFTWQLFFLIAWCFLLWIWLHYHNHKFKRLFMSVLLGAISFMIFPIIVGYNAHKTYGVVLNEAKVYNGPNSSFYQLGSLSQGSLIRIAQSNKRWHKVAYGDKIGWVERVGVTKI